MRSATIVAVLAALTLPAIAPAAKRQPKPYVCSDVSYETGGGYYVYASSKITSLRARCRGAKRLARVDPARVTGTEQQPRYEAFGFTCLGKLKSTRTVAFRCFRPSDDAYVTFSWTTK